jgi:bifunctional non-homologous end joining protein LigD
VPVQLYVFDLLYRGTRSLVDLPYRRRRQMLEDLTLTDEVTKTPPYWADDAGKDLMHAADEQGLEGVIAKRLDSPYQPGARSRHWIKKPLNKTVAVVIAGWKPGEGRRAGMIGSLVLGMYDDRGRLTYVGGVGTGFTQRMLVELGQHLTPLHRATTPFDRPVAREHTRDVHWVQPELVGEVSYRTRTPTAGCATPPGEDCDPTGNPMTRHTRRSTVRHPRNDACQA